MSKAQPLHPLPGLRKHPSTGPNLLKILLLAEAPSSPGVSWTFYAQRHEDIAHSKFLACMQSYGANKSLLQRLFYFISTTAPTTQ